MAKIARLREMTPKLPRDPDQLAQLPLWLYHRAPGDLARRSVLSRASTVRRPSWQASRASAADLLPGDKHFFFGGAVASARASISDEPAVEVVHPPSERLDSSSAPATSAVTFLSFDINAQHAPRGKQSLYTASIAPIMTHSWRNDADI